MQPRPDPDVSAEYDLGYRVSLGLLLGPHRRGAGDPTLRIQGPRAWRTTRTPRGPATLSLQARGTVVQVQGWGEGAEWAVEQTPELLGAGDDPSGFVPAHDLLATLHRRYRHLRLGRTQRVLEALVPAILEQKVTGLEARRSWRTLVHAVGEQAPGPAPEGMLLPPTADQWRTIPSWQWHSSGVGPQRAATIVRATARSRALERLGSASSAAASAGLTSMQGIGEWTSAETRQRSHGDPDALSTGDYHLASTVVFALTGRRGGDDDTMLELLEPYEGQRYRVTRLIELSGIKPERRGPRYSPLDHRGR